MVDEFDDTNDEIGMSLEELFPTLQFTSSGIASARQLIDNTSAVLVIDDSTAPEIVEIQ